MDAESVELTVRISRDVLAEAERHAQMIGHPLDRVVEIALLGHLAAMPETPGLRLLE